MLHGFKTELKLNNVQRTELSKHAGTARHAYNWGLALCKSILDHNKLNPENKIKFPSAIDLHKWLVALVKPENPWYKDVSKCAPQYALRDLWTAWERFFKNKSGVPKFKKKGHHDSFELDGTIKILGVNHIQVPRLGVLRTFEDLPQVKPKNVTISRQADRWFISLRIEVAPTDTPKNKDVVGVDLGVKSLAVLSNGEIFQLPEAIKLLEFRISRLQWLNRNKEKGSANWKKAQRRIAKLWYRATCLRLDALHKLTTYLAKNFKVIVIEDLNVSGLLANHKLARAIQRCGFYEFRRQLNYKCKLYGSSLIVHGRFEPTSKLMHCCKVKLEDLTLAMRTISCPCCGKEIDRDLNAAFNLEDAVSLTV